MRSLGLRSDDNKPRTEFFCTLYTTANCAIA